MSKKITKVNIEKAIEKRKDFLNIAFGNIDGIEKVHISLGNSKLGTIPNFSVLPLVTCKNFSKCGLYCYACKNNYNFNNVIMSEAENTALIIADPERVKNEINAFLDNSLTIYKYFRWNTAGDIFSTEYLNIIVEVAKANPITKFLVFTKNYDLINEYLSENEKPGNLNIVFSIWNNNPDNPHNLPTAAVKENEESYIPEGAKRCGGDCTNCLECWKIKKGENVYFDLH